MSTPSFSKLYPSVSPSRVAATERLAFLDCPAGITDAFLSAQSAWFGGTGPRRQGELQVVCTQSLKDPQLREFRNDSGPVLLIGILKGQVTVGPLQIVGRSVCLACLQYWTVTAAWNQMNLSIATLAEPQWVALAVRLTGVAIAQFERNETVSGLENSLTMVDAETNVSTSHPVFPRGNCPACSNLPGRKSGNLLVHCSPVTGIVKQLKCFEEPIGGVFQAWALSTAPLPAHGTRRAYPEAASWGRGMSAGQAQDSCIGEALEFYSAAYRGSERVRRATLADTPGGIDPRSILLYSQIQYQSRSDSNQLLVARHAVPEAFDTTQLLDWLPGTDLTNNEVAWIPAACCLLGYEFREDELNFAMADRSGCAVGASYSDALAGALLELIEHDSVAIWWYNQIKRPAIQLESLECSAILTVRDALQKAGRRIWVLDLTTDIGIPAYIAVSTMNDGTQPLFGAAAHPSPRIAAEKAVTEVSHLWLCVRIADMPSDFISWMRTASLMNQSHFEPEGEIDAPSEPGAMTTSEIAELCVQRTKTCNLRPVAVNLSRSDVVLYAVRVVAPGMRSLRNRKAPGRLYEVPVQLGWLQAQHTEAELNPICCVF